MQLCLYIELVSVDFLVFFHRLDLIWFTQPAEVPPHYMG